MVTRQRAIEERSEVPLSNAPAVSEGAMSVDRLFASVSHGLERTATTVIVPWSGRLAQEAIEPIVVGPSARRSVRIKITGRRRVTSAKYIEPALDE